MIGPIRTPSQQLVTVFGGTGFLGRHVVQALARRGYRIRVATPPAGARVFPPAAGERRPDPGRSRPICATRPRSPRAVAGADHVVNLVGILQEGGRQSFDDLQAKGPRLIAEAASPAANLVQVSAIGADRRSEAAYARSKAEGEAGLFEERPDAVIIRPSLHVRAPATASSTVSRRSPDCFRSCRSRAPIRACSRSSSAMWRKSSRARWTGSVPGGRVYELGGPEIRTLRDIVHFVLRGHRARAPSSCRFPRRSAGCRAASWVSSTRSPWA